MAREFTAGPISKCRHRHKIKTIRLDDGERSFLEARTKTGRNVNYQIRALIQAEMRRCGVQVTNPLT